MAFHKLFLNLLGAATVAMALAGCDIPDHSRNVASTGSKQRCEHAIGSILCGGEDDQATGDGRNDTSVLTRSDTPHQ